MTTYAKLDVDFHEHRKVTLLTDTAYRLHIGALLHCVRNATDGRLSAQAPAMLLGRRNVRRHIDELVAAGLWEEDGAGWVIHDFLNHQRSRAQMEDQQAAARERMQRIRSGSVRANKSSGSREQQANVRAKFATERGEGKGERGKTAAVAASDGDDGSGEQQDEVTRCVQAYNELMGTLAAGVMQQREIAQWLTTRQTPNAEDDEEILITSYRGQAADWFVEACEQAARQNVRKLSYVWGVIRGRKRDGGQRRRPESGVASIDAEAAAAAAGRRRA